MTKNSNVLDQHAPPPGPGSDRSFGLVFTAVFAIIGLLPLWKGDEPRLWALGAAAAFLVIALAIPRVLRPLNLVWFRLGMAMHMVISPVVMGLMFFVVLTPISLVMRATGKDPLRLKRSDAASYWIVRQPAGPDGASMKNQF